MKIILNTQQRVTDWREAEPHPSFSCHWLRSRLQRIAWWLVKKLSLGFREDFERLTYHTLDVDSRSILEAVHLSQHDIRLIWNGEAKYLVVGRLTAAQLWGEAHSFMSFPITDTYYKNGERKVFGLEVVVVPWIESGFFLLPEIKTITPPCPSRWSVSASPSG